MLFYYQARRQNFLISLEERILFNPETIEERTTFEYPATYVIVNGEVVINEGKRTSALPGKVLDFIL